MKPSWPFGPQRNMKMEYRHGLKFKIPNPKSQTIPNIRIQMTKTYLKLLDFGYLSFEFVWYLMLGIWNLNKRSYFQVKHS